VIDLSSYSSVQSNLFVRIAVNEYRTSPDDEYTSRVLTFSDRNTSTTINSEEYLGLGKLLNITPVNSELRVTGAEMTLSISGIPNESIYELLHSKIKGSSVKVYRGFFNPATNTLLSIPGNPMGRFQGIVTNLTLNEDYDVSAKIASNTLVLNCASVVEVLSNKISGRRTNPTSQNKYFANDKSMDRVPTIENAYFDFGVKK
jgi:hypothetical protein